MLRQIERFIREQDLIPPGSTVLCAVSGGADSVTMLHILYRLREKLRFHLAAAHYNHQLRGRSPTGTSGLWSSLSSCAAANTGRETGPSSPPFPCT